MLIYSNIACLYSLEIFMFVVITEYDNHANFALGEINKNGYLYYNNAIIQWKIII